MLSFVNPFYNLSYRKETCKPDLFFFCGDRVWWHIGLVKVGAPALCLSDRWLIGLFLNHRRNKGQLPAAACSSPHNKLWRVVRSQALGPSVTPPAGLIPGRSRRRRPGIKSALGVIYHPNKPEPHHGVTLSRLTARSYHHIISWNSHLAVW